MSRTGVALVACCVLAWVLVQTAWVSDDAFITLRTIDNFVNGYGLRWNVVERVQGFTHPAWLLVLSPFYALTHEAYYTTLAVQGVLSLLTMWALCRMVAATWGHALMAAGVFLSSKALIDFSTGGLENPLTHFALVVLVLLARQGAAGANAWRVAGVFGLVSVVTLCRQDMVILLLPAIWPWCRMRNWRAILIGAAPGAAWYVFSLLYYGQLVPNTALAKLSTGIAWTALVPQGFKYWSATATLDPVTPVTLVLGIVALLVWGERWSRQVALGGVAYGLYIVWIGGDFMSGRFMTAPLVWVVAGLASLRLPRLSWGDERWAAAAGAAWVVLGLVSVEVPPLLSGRAFGAIPLKEHEFAIHGVTDERRFSYPSMGLLHRWGQVDPVPANDWARFGVLTRARAESSPAREVIAASNVGMFGYWAGPRVHIVDRYGLTDPLLARLPALPGWRIGHFTRAIPDGYLESRRLGRNVVVDPGVHRLFDEVLLVTQAPIFDGSRLRAVVRSLAPGW